MIRVIPRLVLKVAVILFRAFKHREILKKFFHAWKNCKQNEPEALIRKNISHALYIPKPVFDQNYT